MTKVIALVSLVILTLSAAALPARARSSAPYRDSGTNVTENADLIK